MRVIRLTDEEKVSLAVLDAKLRQLVDAGEALRSYKKCLRRKYFPDDSPFDNKCRFDEVGGFIVKD